MRYGTLFVQEDVTRTLNLTFIRIDIAQIFADFVTLYMDECDISDGSGAYHCRKLPRNAFGKTGVTSLRKDLVANMALSIHQNRHALSTTEDVAKYLQTPTFTQGSEGIDFVFNFNALPPRIRPVPGDLVKVVDIPEYRGDLAWVQDRDTTTATLMQCQESNLPTSIPSNAIKIPIRNAMKVHNPFGSLLKRVG